jgi:archaellum component FlaC
MEKEPTIGDVLKAVQAQEARTDQRFDDVLDAVNKGFTDVQEQFVGVQGQITGIQGQIDGLKQEVTEIKAVMVTKDYLDEKLGRQDGKINALINTLEKKAVITTEDKTAILA